MRHNRSEDWRFTVIHFREAIPCGKCPSFINPRQNMTMYGVQQFGHPFDRRVESICPECATEAVERGVINAAAKAYQQIIAEAQRQQEMISADIPLITEGADW